MATSSVFSSIAARYQQSRWMALVTKIIASFGAIAALGLVGAGLADGLLKARPASAAGALSQAHAAAPRASASAAVAPPEDATSLGSSEPSSTESASAAASASTAPCVVAGKVILNTATEDQLRKLPGVGPKKAKAIVELREKVGKFKRLEELFRIKGIKRKLLEKIRPLVLLDPPPDCAP